jgi:hypothetical protein
MKTIGYNIAAGGGNGKLHYKSTVKKSNTKKSNTKKSTNPKVHVGKFGGKYILKNGKKHYLK